MKMKSMKHPKMVPSHGFKSKMRTNEYDDTTKAAFQEGGIVAEAERKGILGGQRKVDRVMDDEKHPNRQPASIEDDTAIDVRTPEQKAKAQSYDETGMLQGYATGGEVEREIEEAASLAAAIMTKRRKMAEGGEISSHDSIYSDDSSQADISRNADEDANEEDQLSFNALRKENYSESEGLEQLDQPMNSNEMGHELEDENDQSITGSIRRKMKTKSPITR